MLERKKFAYCAAGDRCAVATGAKTVDIWRVPDASKAPDEKPEGRIETGRSPLRGLAFVGERHVMTVHQLGECVIWELPERQTASASGESEHRGESEEQEQSQESGGSTSAAKASGDPPSSEGGELAKTGTQTPAETGESAEDIPKAEATWSKNLGFEIGEFEARTRDAQTADRVAIGGRQGELVIGALDEAGDWNPTFGRSTAHESDITAMAFAPRSERLATGGRDANIAIWSTDPGDFEAREEDGGSDAAETGGDESTGTTEGEESSAAEQSQGDAPEEGGGGSGEAVRTREPLQAPVVSRQLLLEGSEGWPLALEFSGDGTRLASVALDNAVYMWDPRADEPLQAVVHRHDNWVTELAWSHDDSHVATGSWDTSVGLFQATDLTPKYRFDAHTDFVSGLHFVAEPDRLVSASYDGTVAIWNWSEGELVRRIRAHADWIEVLVVLPDGRLLTISSEDVLRVWDLESGENLAELGDASFEGFELGRAVDFSDYVEVPELSSDMLGEAADSKVPLDAVEKLSGQQPVGESAGDSGRTAVGILEDAIETSLQDGAPTELADGTTGSGKELLESRIDKSDAPTADATDGRDASGEPKLPEGESAAPEPAGEDEVEEAFSEISEVELDELKTSDEEGTSSDPGDGSSPPSGTDPDKTESVDQFGESIDERVGDTSLDMPDDLDAAEESADTEKMHGLGASGTRGEKGGDTSLDTSDDVDAAQESADTEKMQGLEAPGTDGEEGEPAPEADTQKMENVDPPGSEAGSGEPGTLGSQPSPQLGPPPGDSSRTRDSGTPGGGASPKLDSTGDGSSEPERSGKVGEDTLPSSGPADETTEIETHDAESGGDSEEDLGDEQSEPTAEELKEKFRRLKEKSSTESDSE